MYFFGVVVVILVEVLGILRHVGRMCVWWDYWGRRRRKIKPENIFITIDWDLTANYVSLRLIAANKFKSDDYAKIKMHQHILNWLLQNISPIFSYELHSPSSPNKYHSTLHTITASIIFIGSLKPQKLCYWFLTAATKTNSIFNQNWLVVGSFCWFC